MDKIQKIKQEIERLSDEYPMSRGLLKHLDKFIDSLPEEHGCEVNFTTKNEDFEEEINNYIKDNFFGSGSMGFFSNRTKQELNSVDVANIASHFAEWGKNHFEDKSEIVSEDLDEAADKYAREQYPWQNGYEKWDLPIRDFIAGAEWQKQQMKEALQTEYEKGRFDMREEMMKDAVEGEVRKGYIGNQIVVSSKDGSSNYVAFDASYANEFCIGDNIKIIIIKEN